MARHLTREIADGVKDLIIQLTGFEENSEAFNVVQKHFHEKLRKSDTMYFLNKTEVDKSMAGMAEKYNFHGFFSQSKALLEAYNEYITQQVSKADLTAQLNIVKFLLCMSEKPTVKFLEHPEAFEVKPKAEEEEINWGEYLKEGIENSIQRFDESSDSSDTSLVADDRDTPDCFELPTTSSTVVISTCEKDVISNFRANREELLKTVQHTWYNDATFSHAPFSDRREANIGILWEQFLEKQAMNLVVLNKSNVISEYKVIREILWQLWETQTCSVFHFEETLFKPRKNITISSVRSMNFESFLENQIMPHIQLLEFFRDFDKKFTITTEDSLMLVPQTYRSYNDSLQRLIKPVYLKLSELEDSIREQESTYTLLTLSQDLQEILEPVVLLKKLHDTILIDFSENSFNICAATLLARLHNSLHHAVNKLDQDLRVTLYIESLYYYFNVINSWFMNDDFCDYSGEFLIEKVNSNNYFTLNYNISMSSDKACKEDGILRIISTTVLQTGRNLHLIRLLKDFSVINESTETMYQEFVRRTLEELCAFFDTELITTKDICQTDAEGIEQEISYKCPIIWSENSSQPTDMDKLENLVDTSDGFLMMAFEDYFKTEPEQKKTEELTLYEKISKVTTTFFPVTNFFEKILSNMLKEHFTVSGLKVKKILVEQHHLEKKFQFLRHIFLFFDNLIFPFYRRFFIKVYAQSKNWGNDIWLTSHLQDVIMDVYPEFYENCCVQVSKDWKVCSDPLDSCNMISVNIEIPWPLNIIISIPQMTIYKDIFRFILKIKWGLYTLNHLSFTDLEPRKAKKTKSSSNKKTIMKLKYLRFVLINLLNSVNHYIFSFVFAKCLHKFELDFESANDLSSIVSSHAEFIQNAKILIGEIKENGGKEASFDSVAKCIKNLKYIWENVSYATPERLNAINESYKRSFDIINPIISPEFVFDY